MQELWVQEFDQVRKPKPSEKHVLFSRKKNINFPRPPNSIQFIKKDAYNVVWLESKKCHNTNILLVQFLAWY